MKWPEAFSSAAWALATVIIILIFAQCTVAQEGGSIW